MDRVQELIRESLTARANDVEPTPALWLEVDRRVVRRKRFQVMTWSLAGATAALAAVLVVPAIIGTVTDDRPDLDIGAVPTTPAGGAVPEFYVTDIDGERQIRDLSTGEHLRHHAAYDGTGMPAREIAVRPRSTGDDYAIVAASGGTGEQAGYLEIIDSSGGAIEGGFATGVPSSSFSLPEYQAAPNFAPSAVWVPDQESVALTLPMPEADQTNVVLWDSPGSSLADDSSTAGEFEEIDRRELGLVLGEGEVELLDWVGQTTDTGDESILYYRDDLGVHHQPLTVADDGSLTAGESRVFDGVYDVAGAHVQPGAIAPPTYAVADGEDGPVLQWIPEGDGLEEIPLSDVFGDVDPASLWLDAKQDAALVGDGERTFLFAHDGSGDFAPPAELEAGAVAALFDAPRPGEQAPEPAPTSAPSEETPPEAEPMPSETEETGEVEGSWLPEPVVTATTRDLILHGPDGEQVLYTLPEEGHSTFLDVSVRPGSTVDDLTIVALHLAEGMQDFRTYRYVDGELSVEYWYDGAEHLQVGADGAVGDAVAAFGPVWHPSGDKLAWVEMGTGGTPQLRIIGWDDGAGTGDRATDNASWPLDGLEGTVTEPVDWVDLGGGQTEIRAVATDFDTRWVSIPVEIQPDGGPALSAEAFEWRPTQGDGAVGAVVGTMDDGAPRWMLKESVLVRDPEGEGRKLGGKFPDGFFPEEGLPDVWMHDIGDTVLVGMSNTGRAYFLGPDDTWVPVGGDGIMDGDVVD